MSPPRTETLVVPADRDGERLDRLVVDLPDVGSRSRARKAIASGKVDVDGRTTRVPATPVPEGAEVLLDWDRPGTSSDRLHGRRRIEGAGLRILHADRDVVALDKPAGLLTDTASREQARERDSVRKRVRAWLRAQGDRPYVVHRLDRDTSGVVLVARNARAARAMRDAFAHRVPERVYLAVVHGHFRQESGEWSDWMRWDGKALVQRPVSEQEGGAVLAQARYRVLQRLRGADLVEVRLVSGRRNQVRLQAMLRGHPLVGERLYLPADWRRREPHLGRQALHAVHLGFAHPRTGEQVAVDCPLHADMRGLLEALGGEVSPKG